MDTTTKKNHDIKMGSSTLLVAQGQQNIILTQHDYKHHSLGTPRSSSTDPSTRLREPSKAPSLSLQCAWNLHEGFAEAPYRLHEATSKTRSAKTSRSLLEAFVKPSRRVAGSLNNDKSPNSFMY